MADTTSDDTTGVEQATATETQETPTQAATGTDSPASATTQGEPQDVASLPQWAQDHIAAIRREAAAARTKGKTAADTARSELLETVTKALGLSQDTTPTIEDLTAQVAASQEHARTADLQLAVYRAAAKAGADADALLDSRAFLASMADIDPSDHDAVTNAVREAVAANPTRFSTAQAAGASSIDRPSQAPQTVTPAQFAAMSYAQRVDLAATNPSLYKSLAAGI